MLNSVAPVQLVIRLRPAVKEVEKKEDKHTLVLRIKEAADWLKPTEPQRCMHAY